jgi:RND family efflux transporter MFP subunit
MRTNVLNVIFLIFTIYSYTASAESVSVVYSKQEANDLTIDLTGNIQALNDAMLTSLESGVVKTILVDTGDRIVAGQALIELDDTLAKITLAQAEAAYDSANVNYQENLRLYNEIINLAKNKVVAKTLLAERKSSVAYNKAMLAQAKATLALQQETVNRHKLMAPFSGVIAQRNIDIGEWVNPQDTVLQLVSSDKLRIFIDIPQQYYNAFNNLSSIQTQVTPDTKNQQTITLPLSNFTAVSSPISRTFQARIDLPADTTLISGMSAKVRVILPKSNSSQVTLPKSALKRHPDGSYSVYSVNNNQVKRISVNLLSSSFNQVVVQGVGDNNAIITSGNDLLIDGASVTIADSKGAK